MKGGRKIHEKLNASVSTTKLAISASFICKYSNNCFYKHETGDVFLATVWQPSERKKINPAKQLGTRDKSFINKDVLSVKTSATAKPNTALDPKLLSDFWQPPVSEEAKAAEGTEMTPRGLFNPKAPFHLPRRTFLQYDLQLCVHRV